MKNLPYFDAIFASLDDPDTAEMFADYMHWGYWDEPGKASNTATDFALACERLTELFCQALDIRNGQRILDVGSGFGGLAIYLSNHYKDLQYVGINLDQRQIDVANRKAEKSKFISCEFLKADAVSLPFQDSSFDRVLALETIFHFSSRQIFLGEALRVLRPGGLIGCTDFVGTVGMTVARRLMNLYAPEIESKTWGPLNIIRGKDYQNLESQLDLNRRKFMDITTNVRPSYAVIRTNSALNKTQDFRLINSLLDITAKLGLIRYHLYVWSKAV